MIKSKSNLKKGRVPVEGLFCSYTHRICMQNRLDGFEYCLRHILEDKNSPFKQCSYVSNRSGKRCNNAAPKADKRDGFCTDHAKRAQALRQKSNRKQKPQETPECILEELEHYGTKAITNEQGTEIRRPRPNIDSVANRILDYASSNDSDTEPLLVDQAWRGDGDSDAESVDNEMEDPLKLAGAYTAEEVALITRDKLIRLQSLYIDQFKRLQHIMKEKRRKYIHASRHERDKFGSIHAAKDDPEQREKYDKLMAMKRYHKRNGKEALLHRQSKERRIALSEGSSYKPLYHLKCIQAVDGARCSERVVPLSKYCQKHILSDSHQVLFQMCGFGNRTCKTPVPQVSEEVIRCILHHTFHDLKSHMPPAEPSKVEGEEEVNDSMPAALAVSRSDTPTVSSDQHTPNQRNCGLYGSTQGNNSPDQNSVSKVMDVDNTVIPASSSLESSDVVNKDQLHAICEGSDSHPEINIKSEDRNGCTASSDGDSSRFPVPEDSNVLQVTYHSKELDVKMEIEDS